MNVKYENEDLIADKIARKLGFKDYPDDSVEQGDRWHTEPEKAPFGHTMNKSTFKGYLFKGVFSARLVHQFKLNINHVGDSVTISSSDEKLPAITSNKHAFKAILEYLSGEELVKCQ